MDDMEKNENIDNMNAQNYLDEEEGLDVETYSDQLDDMDDVDEESDVDDEYNADDEDDMDDDDFERYDAWDDYGKSGEKYGWYNGYSDDVIDDAFEGDPEATWNVD